MSKQNNSRTGYKILFGVILAICVISLFSAIGLSSSTLIDIWIPFAIAGVIAVATVFFTWRTWRKLTGSDKAWINGLFHIFMLVSIITGGFYLLNFCMSDSSSLCNTPVTVERKFYKTRHRTKRISRRVYGQGEAYQQYYMEVSFPSGESTEIPVSFQQYRKLREGMELHLPVEQGFFHVPVIKRRGKVIDVPESHYRIKSERKS